MWLPPARALLLALLLQGLLLGVGCRRRPQLQAPPEDEKAPPVKILYPTAPGSFVKLVEQQKGSVVHLFTTTPVRGGPADWFPRGGQADSPLLAGITEKMQRALGTGFIIDADGSILTNAHVVAKSEEIRVKLPDGTEVAAKRVGHDAATDLALLKVDAPPDIKLVPMRLGDSDQLQAGEWVIVLGNPFGLGHTVSAGIVSAKERRDSALGQQGYWGLIQTDAAVSPGNSGGPLCTVLGEVVGVATAVQPDTQGVGFAVPINLAKRILPMLRREGRVVRAWVGIYMDKVTDEKAKELGLKRAEGALVTAVVPRGPAERAGLRTGDVILSFDGKSVTRAEELPWLASLAGVDRLVAVKVWRGGKALSFSLKTERMPE